MYRGVVVKTGMSAWRLNEKEYNIAALLPATERLSIIVRNFPKFPKGLSIASSNPPTLPPIYPCSQTGTEDAATAAAAPKH